MRAASFYLLMMALAASAGAQTAVYGNDAPLPNASELLQRAIANEAKIAAQQEGYECRVSTRRRRTRWDRGKLWSEKQPASDDAARAAG
jgi:hypothetical protein